VYFLLLHFKAHKGLKSVNLIENSTKRSSIFKVFLAVATTFIFLGSSTVDAGNSKKKNTGALLKLHKSFYSPRNEKYLSQKCDIDLKQQKVSLIKDLEKRSQI